MTKGFDESGREVMFTAAITDSVDQKKTPIAETRAPLPKIKPIKKQNSFIQSQKQKNIKGGLNEDHRLVGLNVDEIFKNLREAVNENDIDTILFIASEYDIDLEKDAKVDLYKFYTDAIDSIKDKISYHHSTLAWQWYHGNEQVKEHVTATVKTLYGK